MLKLTSAYGEKRSFFVNPKLVTDIVDRIVKDATEANGYRYEGCIISFGGPEDSQVTVAESAEAVAYEVSGYIETYDIIDVAANQLFRVEAAKAKEPKKCAPDCKGCDYCVPF